MARDGALMATAFDPSRFIEAENTQQSQPVAALASDFWSTATAAKSREKSDISYEIDPGLATIATIAAPDRKTLPWDGELERFVDRPCPAGVHPAAWIELIEEAWDVHRNWAPAAVDAGWDVLDLFGCNPDPLVGRVDRNGLVATIRALKAPIRITSLDDRTATLQPRAGQPMRYYRSPAPGSVPLWSAYIEPDPP